MIDASHPYHTDVFISSTTLDLPAHRKAVKDAVARCSMFPSLMENDTATNANAIKYSLALVNKAEIYVGIFGFRYGYMPEGYDCSITEMEYRRACERDIPRLIFIMSDEHDVKPRDVETDPIKKAKLEQLKAELTKNIVVGFFLSADDLGSKVFEALSKLRLQEIRAQIVPLTSVHAPTVSAIPHPPQPYLAHPYILNRKFFGRKAELKELDDWIDSDDTMLIVDAIGGLGKSALTWQWTKEHAHKKISNLAGVIWWSFYESDATIGNLVRHALAYVTNSPVEMFDTMKSEEREQILLQALREKPYLLVLDGMERILVAYHRSDASQLSEEQVEQQNPKQDMRMRRCTDPRHGVFLRTLISCMPSRILVSTRLVPYDVVDYLTKQLLLGVRRYSIKGLSSQDSLALMNYMDIHGNMDNLKVFLGQFGYHPLLLAIIAGRIINYYPARGDFDIWYQEEGQHLHLSKLNLSERRTNILQYALEGLKPEQRKFLSQIAAFRYPVDYAALNALNPYIPARPDPELPPLSTKINQYVTDIEQAYTANSIKYEQMKRQAEIPFHECLADLENRGLLQWDRIANRYDLHPVVRSYAFEQLEGEDRRNTYTVIRDHFESKPLENLSTVHELSDLRRTLEIYNAQIGAGQLDIASKFYEDHLKDVLDSRLAAYYTIVELLRPLFLNGLNKLPALGLSRQQTARANDLANAYRQIGDTKQTLQLLALVLKVEVESRNVRRLGITLNNYATALIAGNHLAMAFKTHEIAQKLAKAARDEEGEKFLDFYFLQYYADTGQWGKATHAYQRFKMLVQANNTAYWQTSAERIYAQILLYQGLSESAKETLDRAWKLAEQSSSIMDQLAVQSLRGELALLQSRFDEALYFFQETVNIAQKLDIQTALYLSDLARANAVCGKLNEARQQIEQALEQIQETQHLEVNVAEVYLALDEKEQAKKYAIQGYRYAWADGPPYSWRQQLKRAENILVALGVPKPNLATVHENSIPSIPFEKEIRMLFSK